MKMKFILLFVIFFISTTIMYGYYEKNYPQKFTQPNGKVVQCYITGDEYHSRVHDENGYTIIRDSQTGYLVYAMLNKGELISSGHIVGEVNPQNVDLIPNIDISAEKKLQKRNRFLEDVSVNRDLQNNNGLEMAGQNNGTLNNIVVYIRFSDQTEYTISPTIYEDYFNKDQDGVSSMYKYFKDLSYNQTYISSTFYPTRTGSTIISYQDIHPRSYYMPYDAITNTNGYDEELGERAEREHALLARAINTVKSQIPTSLNLDFNNDGEVDNICFIVRGDVTGWSSLLWPHKWALYSDNVTINGKQVWTYNFQLEDHLGYSATSVLCHEMFHSLGAPDLYRYENDNINPVGSWDLMAGNTTPPQSTSIYMKYKYGGWVNNITEITQSGTYTINNVWSQTNNCFKIASPNSTGNNAEFFLIEFRNKSVFWDSQISGSGLLIYRINPNYNGNADGPPDEVYIFRPNASNTEEDGNLNFAHFSDNVARTVFNNTSNPPCFLSNNISGDIRISNISVVGTTMSFYVDLGETSEPVADFSANITNITAGNSITFTDLSTGNPISWSWSFPGGSPSTSNLQNPTVTYNNSGTYDVSLTITNAMGTDTETKTGYIISNQRLNTCVNISNITPDENLSSYSAGGENDYLSGHNSAYNFTEFAEYFNNMNGNNYISGANINVGVRDLNSSNPKITIIVWDVNNNKPGNIIYSQDVLLSSLSPLTLNTIEFTEPVLVPERFFIGFKLYYEIPRDNFVVQIASNRGSDSSIPNTMYIKRNSNWTIASNIIANFNSSLGIHPKMCPAPLISNFTSDITNGCGTSSIQFTDLSTGFPTSWSWDFGDGNTSNLQNPVHVYTTTGIFNVSLTTTNSTNSNSITKTGFITIIQKPENVTVHGNEEPQCGGNVTITATGGNGGTIYWQETQSNGTSTTTASTSQIVNQSGTYYFRAENQGCWGEQGQITVTINTIPEITTVTEGGTYCGSTTLVAAGGNGGTIYWQETQSNGTSTTTASTSQIVNQSGTYYFRAENQGCWGPEGSANVTINAIPENITITGGETPQCGGNVILLATGGNGGTIYWQGTQSNGTNTNIASVSQEVTQSGTYYFRAENQGCWGEQNSVTVTIYNLPVVNLGEDIDECTEIVTLNAGSGFTTYLWNGVSGQQTFDVTTSGTYTIVVYDENNCTVSNQINVNLKEPVVISVSSTPETGLNANNGTASVDVTQVTNPQIIWSNNETTETITGLNSGTYNVTVTNHDGCSSNLSVTVNIEAAPVAEFSADNISGCDNLEVYFIDESILNPNEWLWNFGDGETSTLQSPTHLYLNPGLYTVKLTATNEYGENAIEKIEYITIGETPNITYNVTNANNSQSNDGSITINIEGGEAPYLIEWTGYPMENTTTISNLAHGTYEVIVTETKGCIKSEQIIVSYDNEVNIDSETSNYSIFPNPAIDFLNIVSDNNIEKIEIINTLGEIIYKAETNSSEIKLDVSIYDKGVYFINVYVKNTFRVHKITIQ